MVFSNGVVAWCFSMVFNFGVLVCCFRMVLLYRVLGFRVLVWWFALCFSLLFFKKKSVFSMVCFCVVFLRVVFVWCFSLLF